MISVIGSLEDKQSPDLLYENCRLGIFVDHFKTVFRKLYCDFIEGKSVSIPYTLVADVKRYYDSFGVYVSQCPEGVYYNIPDE